MAKIYQLDPHVADLIAAGEVVERPGSVIKELMENAIDAGSTILTVEIKNGGMTYIRVTDNGFGMSSDDSETAFLRHATSKLRDERGLESITTLGFRGEALAAIAAVSKIELLTREAGTNEGTALLLAGGTVLSKEPIGSPEGTTIIVRDLFYNTPARLKFMKTDRAEGANASSVVLRCALSHPDVSVRFVKDGKEECHSPGDGRIDSCVYSLFGRDFSKDLLAAETSFNDVSVKGYVTSPVHARGNRNHQFFFVNGRFVKSKTLQAALEQAYRNSITGGRFPACVLYVNILANAVDVNVHPTKTEVKFLHDHQVFDGVYYAALAAIKNESEKPEITVSQSTVGATPPIEDHSKPWIKASPRNDFFKTIPADHDKNSGSFKSRIPAAPEKYFYSPIHDDSATIYQTKIDHVLHSSEQNPDTGSAEKSYRIIGEAMETYILVEQEDRLIIIDKHAAHERIHFDKLKLESYVPMRQQLLTPIVCDLGGEDTTILLENSTLLEQFGFELDPFGETAVILRQIPSDIELNHTESFFGELCEKIRLGGKIDTSAVRDQIMHTIACKAAIKAGKRSNLLELEELVSHVISGQIKYCPHGRPVATEMTKGMLDRNFKRI